MVAGPWLAFYQLFDIITNISDFLKTSTYCKEASAKSTRALTLRPGYGEER